MKTIIKIATISLGSTQCQAVCYMLNISIDVTDGEAGPIFS